MTVIDRKSLEIFSNRLKQFKQSGLAKNEANTRRMVIDPLLEVLGWSFYSGEIDLEYTITIGTSRPTVDYAFIIEGKPTFFLEAKPYDSELREIESNQCISYGKVSDVRWVALTNGDTLKLFDTSRGTNEDQCLINTIKLEKLPEGLDELSLLHRDSILSGEIENVVNRIAQTKTAINSLRRNKNQLKEKFKESILSITGDIFKEKAESTSTQLVKYAINLLEGQTEYIQIPTTPATTEYQEIERSQLSTYPKGEVLLTPSKPEGVEFLRKYNAWGFIRVLRKPIYFALYVGRPESKLLYFAEIDRITDPIGAREEVSTIQDQDMDTFEKGKQVIWLKPNSLKKFTDPIPLIDKRRGPRGPRYTTIEKIVNAKRFSDL
ncbi:type I restriction enzyme HsdR N-terminal domain-containing protein [Candidatus Bathyarchaeota archaeon]|nr:type I restriction enzyme HsdR N-terminal domain-containing protein [Candidatus Bathyarchaeota archaeon]